MIFNGSRNAEMLREEALAIELRDLFKQFKNTPNEINKVKCLQKGIRFHAYCVCFRVNVHDFFIHDSVELLNHIREFLESLREDNPMGNELLLIELEMYLDNKDFLENNKDSLIRVLKEIYLDKIYRGLGDDFVYHNDEFIFFFNSLMETNSFLAYAFQYFEKNKIRLIPSTIQSTCFRNERIQFGGLNIINGAVKISPKKVEEFKLYIKSLCNNKGLVNKRELVDNVNKTVEEFAYLYHSIMEKKRLKELDDFVAGQIINHLYYWGESSKRGDLLNKNTEQVQDSLGIASMLAIKSKAKSGVGLIALNALNSLLFWLQ